MNLIKILGVTQQEITVNINIDIVTVNTIEIYDNNIVLHSFVDDIDIEFLFDELDFLDQSIIYNHLKSLAYN